MAPLERVARLLSWCRVSADCREWDHDSAERCRQLLPQIARAAISLDALPPMFRAPLSRFLRNDPAIAEVIDDDERLLLMLSDLRDYLRLMQQGYI